MTAGQRSAHSHPAPTGSPSRASQSRRPAEVTPGTTQFKRLTKSATRGYPPVATPFAYFRAPIVTATLGARTTPLWRHFNPATLLLLPLQLFATPGSELNQRLLWC
jgi:hypothetical protein